MLNQEFEAKKATDNKGLSAHLTYDVNEDIAAPYISKGVKPKVAVLREQGVNSHVEMAAAFDRAGFAAIDVHMSDLMAGRYNLNDFNAMVACGGFSYGDVLGAGGGWAKSILFNPQLRDQFSQFFANENTLSLGVCNGCQFISTLAEIIPGAENWPRFVRNKSERFEARAAMVKINDTNSLWFKGMAGSHMPIAVSHGEGRVEFKTPENLTALSAQLPQHPYSIMGAERVLEKAQDFEKLAESLNLDLIGSSAENHLRVTGLGSYVVHGFHQIVCQPYKATHHFRIKKLRF